MVEYEIYMILSEQYFKIVRIMEALDMLLHDKGVVGSQQDDIERARNLLSEANDVINLLRR